MDKLLLLEVERYENIYNKESGDYKTIEKRLVSWTAISSLRRA